MFCSNCGFKLNDASKFCPNCGTEVPNNNEKVKSNQHQQPNEYRIENNNGLNNTRKNPVELYVDAWKHIFDYQSLTSRRGFWWFYLLYLVSILLLQLVLVSISALNTFIDQLLLGILYLPLISASARRMRDANKSIYWGVIPLSVQWFFQPYMIGDTVSTVIQALLFPFAIIFVVFACQKSVPNHTRSRIN